MERLPHPLADLSEFVEKAVLDGMVGGARVVAFQRSLLLILVRVRAARYVDGLDAVECQVERLDDGEALRWSITDNITAFREDVSLRDRAQALSKFWAEKGDTRNPSPTGLAKMLGVSTSTVADWLELLSEEWEESG